MALLAIITLASLPPTLRYIRWNRRASSGGQLPSGAEIAAVRPYLWVEAALLAATPVLAATMARGV